MQTPGQNRFPGYGWESLSRLVSPGNAWAPFMRSQLLPRQARLIKLLLTYEGLLRVRISYETVRISRVTNSLNRFFKSQIVLDRNNQSLPFLRTIKHTLIRSSMSSGKPFNKGKSCPLKEETPYSVLSESVHF